MLGFSSGADGRFAELKIQRGEGIVTILQRRGKGGGTAFTDTQYNVVP